MSFAWELMPFTALWANIPLTLAGWPAPLTASCRNRGRYRILSHHHRSSTRLHSQSMSNAAGYRPFDAQRCQRIIKSRRIGLPLTGADRVQWKRILPEKKTNECESTLTENTNLARRPLSSSITDSDWNATSISAICPMSKNITTCRPYNAQPIYTGPAIALQKLRNEGNTQPCSTS